MKINISLSAVLLFITGTLALNNGLGRTPQMGWNTWNKFACGITEDLIKQTADKIVEMGLDKLGYTYVNIDDCWNAVERDSQGRMQADPETFPSGMKELGDYIHSKGLKFGIYSSAGTHTCEGRAGSLGNEQIDADTWASWGVDYLKYDNCFNQKVPASKRYTAMRNALNATGRPIFYSICNWGMEDATEWGPYIGNSWRTTQDIKPMWPSIVYNFRWNDVSSKIARPGAWNDPDMLEIGNGVLTLEQERTHFSLWAVAKAPLILGCDLDKISPESLAIISNQELIAINQDPLGVQASCRMNCEFNASAPFDIFTKPQIYAGPLSGGDFAMVIVNWTPYDYNKSFEVTLEKLGFEISEDETIVVRDLWEHTEVDSFTNFGNKIKVDKIPAYGSFSYRISKKIRGQNFME